MAMAEPAPQTLRDRIAELPRQRRAALAEKLARRVETRGPQPRTDPGAPAPLSYAQERLWYLERLYRRRDIFAFPTAIRLRGPLRLSALEAAAADVVARHESLRTIIEEVDGAAAQRVLPATTVDFAVEEPGPDPARCAELASAMTRDGFDLTTEAPLRIRVYRLGDDDHVLVVNQHVAIADVPSRELLLRDLWNRYELRCGGTVAELPPLPIQYADYAIWQRRTTERGRMAELLAWWRTRLAGAPHRLALPCDRPRPARHRGTGRFLYSTAPPGLAELVSTLARRLRTTPSILLLACYRLLLWQQSGQPDVVFGSPRGERTLVETENLIGYFVNVLPMRCEIRDDDTVRSLIEREHEHALGAYARHDLPYEQLVQDLNPIREPGVPPLYQASYSYVPQTAAELSLAPAGLTGELFPLESEGTEYDLGINVTHGPAALQAQWPYNDDILDEESVRALAERFWALVEVCLREPDRPVVDLPAGDPEPVVAQPVAVRWDLDRVPAEAPAIRCGDEVTSYGELRRRSAGPSEPALRAARALTDRVGAPRRALVAGAPDSLLVTSALAACLLHGGELVITDLASFGALLTEVAPTHAFAPAWLLAGRPDPGGITLVAFGETDGVAGQLPAGTWHGLLHAPSGGPATLRRTGTAADVPNSVGAPLPGVRVSVRRDGRPVPEGAWGELYLDGATTGRYARRRHDGQLEVLGAAADLRLVGGVPVHPGELRDLILELPDVAEAVVTPGFRAYVAGRDVEAASVVAALRKRVVAAAVPEVTALERIPRNQDGVDLTALPAGEPGGRATEAESGMNADEQAVAAVWEDLLGAPPRAATDNFFDSGGHSMLLAVLSTRLSALSGAPVPVMELLEQPTVRDQATLLAELRSATTDSGVE
ncbi:condensation domain-containing protein [Paractinoplanes hotanensis]|uniref:Condensation domain-containing protein n=1 Tax=Paractinoplanes hotanensis TaxID=2906497 RepID=A0ABT0YAR1_9ACTN|nr:condensation domain-containing protein [Actinoplanes hotanensis]MCM4083129.1 condensation domain-containing protein [Actinoplanes hotanensis]